MQVTSDTYDNLPVRETRTYRYDDMMAYVSFAAFTCMSIIFTMILSL